MSMDFNHPYGQGLLVQTEGQAAGLIVLATTDLSDMEARERLKAAVQEFAAEKGITSDRVVICEHFGGSRHEAKS
jgi:hypothetical protein